MNVSTGRANQKLRTRNALFQAVRELLDKGINPTLEEVAEAAMISRATAYRYFPSIEALIAEEVLQRVAADVAEAIGDHENLLDRVLAAVAATTVNMLDNEVALHVTAKSMADRWLSADNAVDRARPATRLNFLDEAIRPHADRLGPEVTQQLRVGLGLVCGMEVVISARDVLGLDRDEAMAAFAWAATALVAAAEEQAAR
jgi:AcrR family transcriptional regulator